MSISEITTKAQTSAIPESIYTLDLLAQEKRFLPNVILKIYTGCSEGNKILTAGPVQFLPLGMKKGTSEKKYYLLLEKVIRGSGDSRRIYQGITPKGAPCAIAIPKDPSAPACLSTQEHQAYLALKGCPNILQLKRSEGRHAVFELAAGNLEHYLKTPAAFGPLEPISILRGCLQGIAQMIEKKIVHLDLKPDNILIDLKGTVKIADLEMTVQIDEQGNIEENESLFQGNIIYYSPERRMLAYSINLERISDPHPYGKVNSKESTWAAMQILCHIAVHLLNGSLLSKPFRDRFQEYDNLLSVILKTALELAKEEKPEDRLSFCWLYVHDNVLSYLDDFLMRKKNFTNLFQDLTPKTPLDYVVFPMAYLHNQNRCPASEALAFFDKHFLN